MASPATISLNLLKLTTYSVFSTKILFYDFQGSQTDLDELNDSIDTCYTDYACFNDCFLQSGEKNKFRTCGEICPRKLQFS